MRTKEQDTLRPGPRPVIVVVDDSQACLEISAYLLGEMGYEVITVSDPRSLVDALRASRPELVLADFTMPDIDGEELLAIARADGALACPFVLHSDRPEEELAVIARRAGADGYIRKTAHASHLQAGIDRVLRRAR